jgi:hypothetical protein
MSDPNDQKKQQEQQGNESTFTSEGVTSTGPGNSYTTEIPDTPKDGGSGSGNSEGEPGQSTEQ